MSIWPTVEHQRLLPPSVLHSLLHVKFRLHLFPCSITTILQHVKGAEQHCGHNVEDLRTEKDTDTSRNGDLCRVTLHLRILSSDAKVGLAQPYSAIHDDNDSGALSTSGSLR